MLYLVATPIGNLSDITLRAVDVLRQVDYIASEDTRRTGVLLKHYQIKKPQIAFHEHNERRAVAKIMALLQEGKSVGLVANAGTPGVCDPGFTLVRAAIEAGVDVTMVPGPTAFVPAIVLSGLPVHSFTFRGFAPRKSAARRRFLEVDKDSPHTLIYYESPYRLKGFFQDALDVFGDRRVALAKELTKMFERVSRGRLSELLAALGDNPKGEYVIVIEAAHDQQRETKDGGREGNRQL